MIVVEKPRRCGAWAAFAVIAKIVAGGLVIFLAGFVAGAIAF